MVTAGLQGHIQRGTSRRFLTICQRLPLCMEASPPFVPTLANDSARFHQDSPYHRVGVGPAPPVRRPKPYNPHRSQSRLQKKRCLEHDRSRHRGTDTAPAPSGIQNPGMIDSFQGKIQISAGILTLRSHDLLLSDYTVGPGISPSRALRLMGYTTGGESHPAPKILFN